MYRFSNKKVQDGIYIIKTRIFYWKYYWVSSQYWCKLQGSFLLLVICYHCLWNTALCNIWRSGSATASHLKVKMWHKAYNSSKKHSKECHRNLLC